MAEQKKMKKNSKKTDIKTKDLAKTPEEPSDAIVLAGKKVNDLKKDIRDLGFLVEDLGDGEIKIDIKGQ